MESQAALLSAPDSDTTPALPSATPTTEKCSTEEITRIVAERRAALGVSPSGEFKSPKPIGEALRRTLAAIPKLTEEDIEQREKQRAEEEDGLSKHGPAHSRVTTIVLRLGKLPGLMSKKRYTVTLEADPKRGDSIVDLRRALKCLRRSFGLRCVEAREVTDQEKIVVDRAGGSRL